MELRRRIFGLLMICLERLVDYVGMWLMRYRVLRRLRYGGRVCMGILVLVVREFRLSLDVLCVVRSWMRCGRLVMCWRLEMLVVLCLMMWLMFLVFVDL